MGVQTEIAELICSCFVFRDLLVLEDCTAKCKRGLTAL